MMKKIFSLATVAVMSLFALLQSPVTAYCETDVLGEIRERGYITIATEGNWSPWTYHDEEDNLTGLDIEIGKLIAEGLGVEARFEETDWDSILAGVEAGRFDIACNGVGYTEERAESYLFSDPYIYTHSVLVVREDNEEILTIDDLDGKKTANSPSSTYADIALEKGAEVTYVPTLGETIELVLQGRVDATLNAQESIADYLREHPDAGIKVVQVLEGESICFPVRKAAETETLIAAVNDVLKELREEGTLAELSEKYLGMDLTTNLNFTVEGLLADIMERGYITIATEGNWSPWTYHDEDDNLTGLDIEIGKQIADALGVEARFEETDWDSILAGVEAGRFDIACNGVGYTQERAEAYHFSDPYIYTHSVLVVREDNEEILTIDDLNGKTTANSPSSTYAEVALEKGAEVTYVPTLGETIELVLQGRVDATLNSQESIADYLREHPDAGIKVVQVLEGESICYPVQKTDEAYYLVDAVNQILDMLRDNGTLSEISLKYFGIDMTQAIEPDGEQETAQE